MHVTRVAFKPHAGDTHLYSNTHTKQAEKGILQQEAQGSEQRRSFVRNICISPRQHKGKKMASSETKEGNEGPTHRQFSARLPISFVYPSFNIEEVLSMIIRLLCFLSCQPMETKAKSPRDLRHTQRLPSAVMPPPWRIQHATARLCKMGKTRLGFHDGLARTLRRGQLARRNRYVINIYVYISHTYVLHTCTRTYIHAKKITPSVP